MTDLPTTAAPQASPDPGAAPVPARRRRLFDGPLFWVGLIAFGLVLAAALSFVPARGDTASNKPDVEAFCAQVDILGSTNLITLVAGVASGPVQPIPVSPTTSRAPDTQTPDSVEPDLGSTSTTRSPFEASSGTPLEQLESFDQQLMALERVAPHEVRTDVHEVRLAVDDVLTSLRRINPANPVPPTSLLLAVSDAQHEMQDAVDRMTTYIQDTCGIDIRNPSLLSNPFSN